MKCMSYHPNIDQLAHLNNKSITNNNKIKNILNNLDNNKSNNNKNYNSSSSKYK